MIRVAGFEAARGPLDIEIQKGRVVRIAGANGSGKTSLLRLLAGLPSPTRADAVTHARRRQDDVRLLLSEPRDSLVGLTVGGEFRLRRRPLPMALLDWHERDVANLSAGEARRVGLATCDGGSLWLLDEPTAGLDQAGREALIDQIARRPPGTTVVFTGPDDGLPYDDLVDLGDAAPLTWPTFVQRQGEARLVGGACQIHRDVVVELPRLSFEPGLHVLRAPSGGGKSTALVHLAGLLGPPPRLDGRPVEAGAIPLLGERANELHAEESVMAALSGVRGALPFGLEHLGSRHPLTLSSGEAQRVALAKVLGREAPVYLLDEPESHLDAAGLRDLAHLLRRRLAQGAIVVMASHRPWPGAKEVNLG